MSRRHWSIIGLLTALFALSVGALQYWKYIHFGYNGLDLGIYSQTIWSLAHGHGFASSIHDPSYLGDHLELWLIPISWLYRIWESPLFLLWLQTLLIATSIIPFAKIAHRYLGSRLTLVAAALFFLNPLVYNIALYEFHGIVVALPLLLWSIWWYQQRRYGLWLVSLAAVVLVREDMPFVVAGWGVMAFIDRRGWRWWAPPFFAAAAWFPIAQHIIRVANHDGVYKYLAFYRTLGATPLAMASYPFLHPLLFLQRILSINNLGTILGLTVSFGFLPWVRMRRLWPLLFLTGQLLIGSNPPGSFLRIHYTAPYLPFLAWASFEAVRAWRSGQVFVRRDQRIVGLLFSIVILLAPLYASFIFGVGEWPWSRPGVSASTSSVVLRQAQRDVQPSDRVLTTFALLPQLSNRAHLYSLNYLYLGRRQYSEIPYYIPTDVDVAIIDWQQLYEYQLLYRTTVFEGRDGIERIRDFLTTQNLSAVRQYGTVTVYRRGGTADLTTNALPPGPVDESQQSFGSVALIGQPRVAVASQPSGPWSEVIISTAWQALTFAPDSATSIRYSFHQAGQVIAASDRVIGQGLWQSSTWPVGSRWETRDVVILPASLHGTMTVTADVIRPEGHYQMDRWRSFRAVVEELRSTGQFTVGSIQL